MSVRWLRVRIKDYWITLWQLFTGERTKNERVVARKRCKDIEEHIAFSHLWRILDLANGRLRPQYYLLKADGHQVFGIDYVNTPQPILTEG